MTAEIYDDCLTQFFGEDPETVWESFDKTVCDTVVEIAELIRSGKFPEAQALIHDFPADSQRVIQRHFSRSMLRDMQKEWTGHGINCTFRFWTAQQKYDYLSFCGEVIAQLQKAYEACLGYGSVLSIVRDNDLIPHDDDLDIIVLLNRDAVPVYKDALLELHEFIEAKGFGVQGDYVAHRHVSNGKYMVDVFLGLQEGEFASWHPGPRKSILYDEVFPAANATLYGLDCKIPRNSERYLAKIYGDNWRVPIPGWTHDFNPAKYGDWFWPKGA